MRGVFRLLFSSFAVALLGMPTWGQESSLDDVVRSWEARQAKLTSLQLEWTETYFIPKGSQFGKDFRRQDDSGAPFPPEDVRVERAARMVFGRDRWRMEWKGVEWAHLAEELLPVEQVRIFDGENYVTFSGMEKLENDAHNVGFLNSNEPGRRPLNSTRDPRIWPPFSHFRPLHPLIGDFKMAEWNLRKLTAAVADRRCLVLEQKKPPGSAVFRHVFVDPERDHVILRSVLGKDDKPIVRVDIAYAPHGAVGWVPAEWNVVINQTERPDLISHSYESKVISHTVNEPIQDDWFAFEFPANTEVIDKRGEKEVSYLVKADAETREITREERLRGGMFRDFLETETGEAAMPKPNRFFTWIVVFNILFVGTLVTLWFKRRNSAAADS